MMRIWVSCKVQNTQVRSLREGLLVNFKGNCFCVYIVADNTLYPGAASTGMWEFSPGGFIKVRERSSRGSRRQRKQIAI